MRHVRVFESLRREDRPGVCDCVRERGLDRLVFSVVFLIYKFCFLKNKKDNRLDIRVRAPFPLLA